MITTHEEIYELLAPMALDAVDELERTLVEEHVAHCPRCRAELDALRNVAAALGNGVEAPPEHLWASISSRLYENQGEETPPMPRLILGGRHGDHFATVDEGRSSSRTTKTIFSSLLAAAAAVVLVLGINLAGANNQVARLQGALGESAKTAVLAALAAPGHVLVNLDNANHVREAQFVMLPNGNGFLVKSSLPTLSSDTYQLWGIVNGKAISLGLMGGAPSKVGFTAAGSPGPTTLAVSVEPPGGSSTPSNTVVASGPV